MALKNINVLELLAHLNDEGIQLSKQKAISGLMVVVWQSLFIVSFKICAATQSFINVGNIYYSTRG